MLSVCKAGYYAWLAAPARSPDLIEIELPRGYRVRIGGGIKAATLRLVLDALERR